MYSLNITTCLFYSFRKLKYFFLANFLRFRPTVCTSLRYIQVKFFQFGPPQNQAELKQLDIGPANKAPLGRGTFVQTKEEEEAMGKSVEGV